MNTLKTLSLLAVCVVAGVALFTLKGVVKDTPYNVDKMETRTLNYKLEDGDAFTLRFLGDDAGTWKLISVSSPKLGLLSGDASPCIYVKHVTEQKKIRTVYDCTYSKDMVLVLEKQSADGISLVDQVSITIS